MWVLADWKFHGERLPVQLVELGPGRGTLISDMLRVCLLWREMGHTEGMFTLEGDGSY